MEQNAENTKPEGWLPEMRRVGDLHPVDAQSSTVVDEGALGSDDDDKSEHVQTEAEKHWKERFESLDAEARSVLQYKGIINELEHNPKLVDVLQRHIANGVGNETENQGDIDENLFGDGEDETNTQPREDSGAAEARQRETEKAMIERKARFEVYCKNLMEGGMPEHEVDKFVQFVMQPSELSFDDMFSMFEGRTKKESKKPAVENPEPNKGEKELPPPTSASGAVGGESDRPDSSSVSHSNGGERFVSNPNAI